MAPLALLPSYVFVCVQFSLVLFLFCCLVVCASRVCLGSASSCGYVRVSVRSTYVGARDGGRDSRDIIIIIIAIIVAIIRTAPDQGTRACSSDCGRACLYQVPPPRACSPEYVLYIVAPFSSSQRIFPLFSKIAANACSVNK